MSFVAKVMQSRAGGVSLLIAPAGKGRNAWYFIRVEGVRGKEFKEAALAGPVNLPEYGNVIRRGWGDYPPEDVIREMIEKEGFRP